MDSPSDRPSRNGLPVECQADPGALKPDGQRQREPKAEEVGRSNMVFPFMGSSCVFAVCNRARDLSAGSGCGGGLQFPTATSSGRSRPSISIGRFNLRVAASSWFNSTSGEPSSFSGGRSSDPSIRISASATSPQTGIQLGVRPGGIKFQERMARTRGKVSTEKSCSLGLIRSVTP